MKKIAFAFLLVLLVACSAEEAAPTPAPEPPPETETPAPPQNVDSDVEENVAPTPVAADAPLTEESATVIIQQVIDDLRDATVNVGEDATIEAIKEAWTPYVTQNYMDNVSEYLECGFEYCGALYQIPNSPSFGWNRQFHILDNDTFSTDALVPNVGDTIALFSLLQSMELKREDGVWKLNHVDFQPEDIHLVDDTVIPYLAQVYDVHITDFRMEQVDVGEFQHGFYIFTHPEENTEYFVDAYTGTMYELEFFMDYMNQSY